MKALKWLEKNLEAALLTIMLTMLVILVMLQIIMRYVVEDPLTWSEELARMLLSWSGFISIGYCARRSSTIRLDTILVLLPAGVQRVLNCLSSFLMIALLGYLFYGAYGLVIQTAATNALMVGLEIPQYWLYMGALVGLGLGLIRFVQMLILTRFHAPVEKEEG